MSSTYEQVLCKKIRIYPTGGQQETFEFWMRRCNTLYNVALEEKICYYKVTGKYLSVYDQKKELKGIKAQDPTWKDVPNKPLQDMIFRLDRAYKNFFDKISGFPKFQSETDTISFVKTDVRVVDGQLLLPKIKNRIKVKEDIPVNYTSVKLHREDGMWFLIFTVKEERTSTPDNSDILGIDLGLKDLYTTSEGEKGGRLSKKLIKKYHYRTKYLNQSLSKKTKGSRRFKKVKKHLKRAYTRLKNTKNDYLHKQANRLLDCTEGVIALGNIDVQSIVTDKRTSKGLIKSFYINSLGIFKQYVTYKAVRQNKTVIPIDEKNTSRTCSCCGNNKYDLKLGDRVYNCRSCNNSIDRDVNAAVNMKRLGSSSLSERTDSSIIDG